MSTKKYEFTAQDVIERILSDKEFRNELLTCLRLLWISPTASGSVKKYDNESSESVFSSPVSGGIPDSSNRRIRSAVDESARKL